MAFVATKRTTSNYDKDRPQLQVVDTKIYYVWREFDGSYYQIWTAEVTGEIEPSINIKHWTGTEWKQAVALKRWTGSAWVDVTLKYWTGTIWK